VCNDVRGGEGPQENKELTALLEDMEKRGMSRAEMARKLGVSKASITQKFKRMRGPDWFREEMKQ
jgi:Mn-dependent DtxR family transcriptional regulator